MSNSHKNTTAADAHAPATHAASHQNGGSDEIDVTGLTGLPDLAGHTGDTSDAHAASAISFTPAGSIAATDVQAAIEEVAAEAGSATAPTTYTPTLTGSITNPTLGTGGTATGRYQQVGKLVVANFNITFGSSGVNAGSGTYYLALPVTSRTGIQIGGSVVLYDSSAGLFTIASAYFQDTGKMRIAIGTTALQVSNSNPWAWAADDQINGQVIYEAA